MLQTLRIRNLALLEEVALEFESGFTVVTGETGAGKSILLGALGLLAGARADKTLIRQGAAACEVEAALFFEDSGRLDTLLVELELPPTEDGVLLLKRSLPREKAPRISVNGSLATLAALQRLADAWVDFHGPGEPRRLLKESCQLELLDLFARDHAELADYHAAYRSWRELVAERERLTHGTRLAPDQIAFVEAQLAKLDALELTDEAIADLERDFSRLSRAQELTQVCAALEAGLAGEDGVASRIGSLLRDAHQLEQLDPASRPLTERLHAASIELNDLADELRTLVGKFQFDPEQAEILSQNMSAWLDAKRRHGGDVAAVAAAREALRRRLEVQGDLEGALAKLDGRIATARAVASTTARTLRTVREKASSALAKVGAQSIAQLGFKRAEFLIRLVPLAELGPEGDAGVEFLFSPNVGEAPLPLSRIASSGELARVMLALKTVLADLDGVPVLVFDEVDANVGGEIGRVVGEKMSEIARSHQVLCITHLPQVAGLGDRHLLVEKDQSGERAVVTIQPIHARRETRIGELARMLGDRHAKSALQHAAELLKE
ncbi:MAG: DNA repair protein RecN [Verrucomicrobia bacterium]|nr:MAG: DNA repair protein RecN [Verrucomicrobiota bacterium]